MKKIILASASPRRRELMMQAGYEFEVQVSHKEETYSSETPDEIVKELALLKARDIAEQNAVEDLVNSPILRGELAEALKDVTDLERVMTRIVTGTVNCRDLLGFARGLRALPQVKAQLSGADAPLLKKLDAAIDALADCADRIENTIVDEPPPSNGTPNVHP